ncbi:rab3 GTPase-activating protein non-catalytic subunit [Neocloeon triangulifer]|uniref:rab3 GTPase-activating protein non-catalytic subunit n=1 Tax=Neocloeon triangulifer TaxID=2078957 RepID=UPI00286F0102|nr:rab3 GTPase-activating protein non-catalytic subunit [Neocloeon triangulifer]
MACQITEVAQVAAIQSVKAKLTLNEFEVREEPKDDFDPDNWEWEETTPGTSSSSNATPSGTSKETSLWLQKSKVSLSPSGKILVLAHGKQLVVLNAFLSTRDQTREAVTEYNVTSHGNVCQPGEEITAVLCLPLISQLNRSSIGTEWTCIAVGYSSGFVRFYTEDRKLLTEQEFEKEPVIHLKCQSFKRAAHSEAQEQPEELYVMYPSSIVTLPGFSLFQTLRGCRNQLARVEGSGSGSVESPPLVHTKWGFAEQDQVNDCQVIGLPPVNTYDHLLTASLCGGFEAVAKSSAPAHDLVIATGRKPYVGYHFTVKGTTQPLIVGVAKAVSSALNSTQGFLSLKSYFTGSKPAQEKKQAQTIEPAEPMGCRFGLGDLWRQGEAIVMSPNKALSAVCDSLGRVILLDNRTGVALRMWKGYREAQCGWFEVRDPAAKQASSKSKTRPRSALFLVIYVPKKGIIEIWAMQNGPKVASFNVTKEGRLIYTNYGHVGVNNVPVKGSSRSLFPCVYMHPDGVISTISIPFHFALSAQNSKQAKDIHLLKKLRKILKECKHEEEADYVEAATQEISNLMKELSCCEAALQAVDLLLASKYTRPQYVLTAVDTILAQSSENDEEENDHNYKTLKHNCVQLQKLVMFFNFLQEQNKNPPSYDSVISSDAVTVQALSVDLLTSEKEMESLFTLVNEISEQNSSIGSGGRVTFQDDDSSILMEFLSAFDLGNFGSAHQRCITLRKDKSDDCVKRIAMTMFQDWLHGDNSTAEWMNQAEASGIHAQSFFILALHFWLQVQHKSPPNMSLSMTLAADMLQLNRLLNNIQTLADQSEIVIDTSELSPWWEEARRILFSATQPLKALTASYVCRGVNLKMEMKLGSKSESKFPTGEEPMDISGEEAGTADWEELSMDTVQWNVLLRQLEDLSVLDFVMQQRIKVSVDPLPRCLKWKSASISLNLVMNKGKGAISEYVAYWIGTTGIQPKMLVELDRKLLKEEATVDKLEPEQAEDAVVFDPEALKILDLLQRLRNHFPLSLQCNQLLASLFWEFIQDRTQLITNSDVASAAITVLHSIPSLSLRQGMCSLLWTLYLKQDLEKISRFFNKKVLPNLDNVGFYPRHIFEDIGHSDAKLSSYLDFCVRFLDTYFEAAEDEGETSKKAEVLSESIWTNASASPSLSQIALSKPKVNFGLLELHLQLVTVLFMVASFDFRIASLISNLFDSAGQAAFFLDLHANPRLPSHNPSTKLTNSRTQFLLRVISASMQNILLVETSDFEEAELSGPRVDASQAALWMGKSLILASSWGINTDILRRHQICELYMNGFDRLAEENVMSVNDKSLLASQLLMIVGQRLQIAVTHSADLAERISILSPAISNWLENVNVGGAYCASSLADTAELVGLVVQLLPEDHNERRLALLVHDACNSITKTTSDM